MGPGFLDALMYPDRSKPADEPAVEALEPSRQAWAPQLPSSPYPRGARGELLNLERADEGSGYGTFEVLGGIVVDAPPGGDLES